MRILQHVLVIRLNGDSLPWKDKVNHLGTTLTSSCISGQDIMEKRASFISTVYNLNQEFVFATPETRLKLCRLYNTAFYGSNCWDFSSAEVARFAKTWNVNIRIMFNLPRETHCWIVEELSGGKHFLQMIFSRFIKYISALKNNTRPAIRELYSISANDVRTTTGGNVRRILLQSGMDPRSVPKQMFANWRVYDAVDTWTVPLVHSLLLLKSDTWEVNFDLEEEEGLKDAELTSYWNLDALARTLIERKFIIFIPTSLQ